MTQDASAGDRYRQAGVDIDAGERLVRSIGPLARRTARPGAEPALGGFGGLFDLAAAGFRDPILVSATDGVGTKILLLAATGRHRVAGIDLVAMCVNDLVVQAAEPLFFLDYLATGRLDPEAAEAVIAGIADGCGQAGCALIGGETAEMPGVYRPGEYDLAGFAVGAAERGALLPHDDVGTGDVLLGIASGGLHANGFSLVRKILEEQGLAIGDAAPFAPDTTLAEALLAPTRIYVRSCLEAVRGGGVKALAHITGGGLLDNLPRVLPEGTRAVIDATAWTLPPVFAWLARAGGLKPAELARTFNCGIGMVAVAAASEASAVRARLAAAGEEVFEIGRIEAGDGPAHVTIKSAKEAWAVGPQPS